MQKKPVQPDVFEMILDSMGTKTSFAHATPKEDSTDSPWLQPQEEGQLAIDVVDNGKELVVISTMAGADTDKIEVYVHNDLLTVRGVRKQPFANDNKIQFLHKECFWGPFSRTVVLPVDVNGHKAKAEFKNGVLIVYIEKRDSNNKIPIKIVED
jgi:HSP20 family protein